jgi:hypothetical protein
MLPKGLRAEYKHQDCSTLRTSIPTLSRFPTAPNIAARLSMLGLPLGDSIRCRLLLGLAVSVANSSNPKVAQNDAGWFRLAVKEQRSRLVQQRPRKCGVALYALDHGLFEVTGQCHRHHLFRVVPPGLG